MAAIITIGAPMTADISIEAIANMGTGMAISIGGTGKPMTEDNTVTKGVVTAASRERDIKDIKNMCELAQDEQAGAICRMDAPDCSSIKLRHP